MHVGIGLHRHVLIDAHRAADADPAQIVALQIDQHDVLRALLFVVEQRLDQRRVALRRVRRAAGCRRSDASRRRPRESTAGAPERS